MGLLKPMGMRPRRRTAADAAAGGPASPVVANTGRFMVGDVLDRVLGLAFLLAATSLYGVAAYGTYVVGLTVFQLVRTVVGFGLGRSLLKDAAAGTAIGDLERVKGAIALGFAVSMTVGLLAATVLVVGAGSIVATAFPGQQHLESTLRMFGVLTPLFAVNFVLLQSFYGVGRVRDMVVANSIVEPVVRLGALVVLFAGNVTGPIALPAAYLVALVASSVYAGIVFRSRVWPQLAQVRARIRVRETLGFAVPVMLTDLFTRGFRSFNTFLFAVFRTSTDVGLFDIAIKLSGVALFFSGALMTAFRPRIAALLAEKRIAELSSETQCYTRWILSVAILPLGLLILMPAPILGVMSGAFVGAATAVRILSCGLLVAQAAGPLVALLLMSGRSRQVLGIIVGGASLYTLASLYAIPNYGIDGAAAAATGTVLLVVPVLSVHVQRTLGVRIYDWALWKPLVAASVAYSVALLLSTACGTGGLGSVVMVGSVATTVYVGALVAFGAERDDHVVLALMRDAAQRILEKPALRRRARGAA